MLALAALSFAASTSAKTGPPKAVRWIVPYSVDKRYGCRDAPHHPRHGKALGPNIYRESPAGGAPLSARPPLLKRKPNGYVIGTADSGTLAFSPTLYAKLPYRADSFTYVGGLAKFPLKLAARADSPFKSLDDIIQAVRKAPDTLSASSAEAGLPHHLALWLFQQRAKVNKVLHVPHK